MINALPTRLEALFGRVPPGPVADIGCDHGLLSCALAQAGHTVYAVDISPSALSRCQALSQRLGLEGWIHARLGNGLDPLEGIALGSVVIAGIGAATTAAIVCNNPRPDIPYLLMPASRPEVLRRALREHGFGLVAEDLIFENRRYYALMVARLGGNWPWPPWQDALGPLLLAGRHPLLPALAQKKAAALLRAQQNAPPGRRAHMQAQLEHLQEVMAWPRS